jgi:hypothetical protein
MDIGKVVNESVSGSISSSLRSEGHLQIWDRTCKLKRASAWNLIDCSVQDSVRNSIWIPIIDDVLDRTRSLK